MSISYTTALTIIGSFGAASTAQIINHILTQRREDKKYKKECLQYLYSPAILKVIDYIRFEAHNNSSDAFDNENHIDTELLFEKIMNIISSNLKYAEPELINIYQEIRDTPYEKKSEECTPNRILDQRITLTNIFLSGYLEINTLLKIKPNSITKKITAPYLFSHFYLLARECFYLNEDLINETLELYDLIEFITLPINNFLERIISIRQELNIVINTPAYKDKVRVQEAHISAYQFMYELAEEFSIASQERADNWKDLIDEEIGYY